MEQITLIQAVGLAGFFGYIGSFASLQLGFIDGNGKLYAIVNIVSATLVLISLTEQFNLASALIQISWIVFGLIGIALKLAADNRRAVSPATVRRFQRP